MGMLISSFDRFTRSRKVFPSCLHNSVRAARVMSDAGRPSIDTMTSPTWTIAQLQALCRSSFRFVGEKAGDILTTGPQTKERTQQEVRAHGHVRGFHFGHARLA